MTARIAVIGSLNMDLVVRVKRHPKPGETLTGHSFHTLPGGKGANQAVAAARMGAEVTMIGCIGPDDFGSQLIASLTSAGVIVQRIQRAEEPTGIASITVSDEGDNSIVVVPGANGAVTPALVRASEDAIAAADAVLLQLEVPMAAVEAAAEVATRHGVPVILNPAPAQPLDPELLQRIAYLIPNEHEAAWLAGRTSSDTPADLGDLAGALRARGAGSVIITLGEQGALLSDAEGAHRIPSFRVQAVDSTAAGDAFVGAFAVALSERRTPREAVLWGCAAGAAACTRLGAQPSLPDRRVVLDLLATRSGEQ
jgi:ribokinase